MWLHEKFGCSLNIRLETCPERQDRGWEVSKIAFSFLLTCAKHEAVYEHVHDRVAGDDRARRREVTRTENPYTHAQNLADDQRLRG